ncbi:MAG: adenylosuccinate synthase [Chloroflexi bacterium]|nr:adenylosuccinate synthase [Chloroflexota bacterium]
MPATILVGAQWGDEGKGRAVDWLASSANIVARYSGGDNAGHTVFVRNQLFKLHLLPSGILHQQTLGLLGSGMVINPLRLVEELDQLAGMGVHITPERLAISTRAHIITPAHIALDGASEKALGSQAIGTTQRGIGPAYIDKASRRGIRAGEMADVENFAEALEAALERGSRALKNMALEPLPAHAQVAAYVHAAKRLSPYLRDTVQLINEALSRGGQVLCEGAQGTLLDLDHGSYPFVTSSSATAGGALTGLGFGPKYVERVVGVAKAFSTRVGGGPLPTELSGALGDRLRGTGENFWDEFGTTTGRPRRCGWLDGVMLRYAAAVNGLTELIVTKLDILTGFDELKIAVGYKVGGQRYDYPPATLAELEHAQPVYESFSGWRDDVRRARDFGDLPRAARDYVRRIGEICATPVRAVSVGPEREQLVLL